MEHKVELIFGYTDKEGITHRDVTFGHRLKTAELIALDVNPQAQNPSQYEQMIRRLMITKFGSMKMPTDLRALTNLDLSDNELLEKGADDFLRLSRGERESEIISNSELRLMFGFEFDGAAYDYVKFGHRLTVADNIEADRRKLTGIARSCFLLGQQICELRASEAGVSIQGKVSVDSFSDLDSEDLGVLRLAAEFFRIGGAQAGRAERRPESNDIGDSETHGVDGRGNSETADREV